MPLARFDSIRATRFIALPLLTALIALSCAGHGRQREKGLETPAVRDFVQFPATFRGRQVRLGPIRATRVQVDRPLVLRSVEREIDWLEVLDARFLASRSKIAPGELVVVVFHCTEGKTDRGNILIELERYTSTVGASQP